jgi:GNAT superfamily N-acetyltransferase
MKCSHFLNVDRPAALVTVFNSKGSKKRAGVNIRMGGTAVFVELNSFGNSVHISEISIPNHKQGQGIGHKVMKMITDMADKFKVNLDLFPKPISQAPDEEQISKSKLVKFYAKHGFKPQGAIMFRNPK